MSFFHPLRLAFKIVGLLVLAIIVYFAVTLVQVWLTSRDYDPRPAAGHRGDGRGAVQRGAVARPRGPAATRRSSSSSTGYAPLVAVTGSKEKGDQFTEARVGSPVPGGTRGAGRRRRRGRGQRQLARTWPTWRRS